MKKLLAAAALCAASVGAMAQSYSLNLLNTNGSTFGSGYLIDKGSTAANGEVSGSFSVLATVPFTGSGTIILGSTPTVAYFSSAPFYDYYPTGVVVYGLSIYNDVFTWSEYPYSVPGFSPETITGTVVVTSNLVAAVPEPATWALLAGGAGLLLIYSKRRRQSGV